VRGTGRGIVRSCFSIRTSESAKDSALLAHETETFRHRSTPGFLEKLTTPWAVSFHA
jgi:hypothetical protein